MTLPRPVAPLLALLCGCSSNIENPFADATRTTPPRPTAAVVFAGNVGAPPGSARELYAIDLDGSGLTRLTFWGAIYITAVCLMPEFMILEFNVPFYFGGTSLLIIVVVTMDFMAQLQAHMMTHQYEGLLKKANLRGYGRT